MMTWSTQAAIWQKKEKKIFGKVVQAGGPWTAGPMTKKFKSSSGPREFEKLKNV